MNDIDDKLERGFARLAQSNGRRDLLGAALLAIHSALEDHLRAVLRDATTLSEEERTLLDARDTGWVTLTNLAQRHAGLRSEHRSLILDMNDLRRRFAHGEEFTGDVGTVLRYARLVEALCDRKGLLDGILLDYRETARRAAPTRQPGLSPFWRDALRNLAVIAVVALFLFIVGRALYARLDADLSRLVGALGAAPATPTVGIQPTLDVPTPTPPRRAQIVNLGDAIGWMHEQPNFASGTLPAPLRDGLRVTVLDQQQTDADGVPWQAIAFGGYEGWVPANNLAFDTP